MTKQSKMKNKWVEVDGIKFQSIAESEYYLLLKKSKEEGHIVDFTIQPSYILQLSFVSEQFGHIKPIVYKADFKVIHTNGDESVIDVKGQATPVSLIKRKMFLMLYGNKYNLQWVAKSKKWGNKHGWIDYFELERIRKANRKMKK